MCMYVIDLDKMNRYIIDNESIYNRYIYIDSFCRNLSHFHWVEGKQEANCHPETLLFSVVDQRTLLGWVEMSSIKSQRVFILGHLKHPAFNDLGESPEF